MYVRMILIMIVSIYTSRVVLDKLGVDDFGIYNAVASIVSMVLFLNTTLATSTSRFLTYDIGVGDFEKLKRTFSTSFYTHLILAGIIVFFLETLGLWYMANKFVIPEGRDFAVHIVFQISIITTAITIIQVPYTASIVAHENMDVYAYVGIFDVFARLGIVYLLSVSSVDKLVLYALFIAVVHIMVIVLYVVISHRRYRETRFVRHFSKGAFHRMIGFTGWTAVANFSNILIAQGSIVLLNLFFSPAIIAAKALANQVNQAIMQFVNNFRVALNPQIIKSYATGDFDDFKILSLRSTVVSSDLILILGLPCIVTMRSILGIWLIDVPPLAVEFTQLTVITQILGSIISSTYIPFVATGRLKLNALWGGVTSVLFFFLLYYSFNNGAGALWDQWLLLISSLLSVLFLRPYLLHKEIGFPYVEIYRCLFDCIKPIIISGVLAYLLTKLFNDTLWQQIILFLAVFTSTCTIVWFFLEKAIRNYFVNILKSKLLNKK